MALVTTRAENTELLIKRFRMSQYCPDPSLPSRPIEPTLANIEALTPPDNSREKNFDRETARRLDLRKAAIFESTVAYFSNGRGASIPEFKAILDIDPDLTTPAQLQTEIRKVSEKVQAASLRDVEPLFTRDELLANALTRDLDIPLLESNIRTILVTHLEQTIHEALTQVVYNGVKKPAAPTPHTKRLSEILRKADRLTDADIDEWIQAAALEMPIHERQRLAMTGLVDLPEGTSKNGTVLPAVHRTRSFDQLRETKTMSAIFSVASGAIAATAIVATGGLLGFGIATAATVLNLAVQVALKVRHDNILEGTFRPIVRELEKAYPEGCAAWAGVLAKFIRQANPLWIASNQTDVLSSNYATSIDSVVDHLKTAADVANSEANVFNEFVKGLNYKDHVKLCQPGLKKLEERWNWWYEKQKVLAPYMAVGCAAGALSQFAGTIVPRIP